MSLTFDPASTAGQSRPRPTEPVLTIGEVADLAGTTTRALRHYEDRGLLLPLRSRGNSRLYGARTLARARRIVALRHLGVALEEIAPFLDGDAVGIEVERLQARVLHAETQLAQARAVLRNLSEPSGRTV